MSFIKVIWRHLQPPKGRLYGDATLPRTTFSTTSAYVAPTTIPIPDQIPDSVVGTIILFPLTSTRFSLSAINDFRMKELARLSTKAELDSVRLLQYACKSYSQRITNYTTRS